MMLIEQTTVPAAALPVQELKGHLRLGTGFADDGMQDSLIESYLRAAIAMIEGRIGKVLLARSYLLSLENWRMDAEQPFPIAPVTAVTSLTRVDAAGVADVLDPALYRLVQDRHRPKLVAAGSALPQVPAGGRVELVFEAGFGVAWPAVPEDLAQAVLMLAADYYERRHDGADRVAGLPFGVQALIERWRTVRVLGGGAA